MNVLRSVGAVIASLVVAFVLVVAVEFLSAVYHPFPPGVDPSDLEVCRAHVAKYPQWLLALCGMGWGVTMFVSVWLATRLGAKRHPAHGLTVGLLLTAAAAFNIWMLPYYTWFKVIIAVIFPLAIFLGIRLGRGTPVNIRRASSQS